MSLSHRVVEQIYWGSFGGIMDPFHYVDDYFF